MVEISQEGYAAIGALVVTNAGTLLKLYLDKRKAERDEDRAAAESIKKQAVETAVLQAQMTTLTMTIGELKEGFRDLRQDFNNAYGKWREKSDT